jgi:two-component system, sensor histidine kinase PdtaS
MRDSISTPQSVLQFPWVRRLWRDRAEERHQDGLIANLSAPAREEGWLREKSELLRRQDMLAQEFEHRLINSLQIIVSLLSLQSRTASPEAAAQLKVAAGRVASFGRVHQRLHLLDHQESVEFKQYLQRLCEDLSGLLFQGETGHTIRVVGPRMDIPTVFAIPLGFIVNELVINSAKHARSNITVRLQTMPPAGHVLSVLDDGPGWPAGFDPAESKGLGMRLIGSLVKQIGGELKIGPGQDGSGACSTVTFGASLSAEDKN